MAKTIKRLINVTSLIEAINDEPYMSESAKAAFRSIVCQQPLIDDAPVVHGRWEQVQRWATKAKYRCSVCGREVMSAIRVNIEKYPYCHCGARMDGDTNG